MARGKGGETQVSTTQCLLLSISHQFMSSMFSPILLQWVPASVHSFNKQWVSQAA